MNELLTFWRISKVMWVVVMLITCGAAMFILPLIFVCVPFSLPAKWKKYSTVFLGTIPDWLSTNYVKKIIISNTNIYIYFV